MTASTEAALAPVTALVGHLRWRAGTVGPGDLIAADLAADPHRLARVVAAGGTAWRTDDPQVLASLWWQAYAYRVAGTTLAAWLLTGTAPDPAAPGAGVGRSGPRPSSLLVDPCAAVIDDLDDLVHRLFADHLDPVAAALRVGHAVGERLIWGDAAAGVASALGAVGAAGGAPRELRGRAERATAALPHGIPRLGAWAPDRWAFRRRTCCLWWKTAAADGRLCEDCSLRPAQKVPVT